MTEREKFEKAWKEHNTKVENLGWKTLTPEECSAAWWGYRTALLHTSENVLEHVDTLKQHL